MIRLGSIDTARFLAIGLVFYGHLVEQVMYLGSEPAALQYKWVYSFHMALFFLLSGMVASERRLAMPLLSFIGRMARSRLVPYLVFGFVPMAVALAGVPGWFPTVDLTATAGWVEGGVSTLMGLPAFNIPLWFLASLIVLELVHQGLARFWTSTSRLLLAIVFFYSVGYLFNRHVDVLALELLFWMAHVVPLGYAFYLTGVLVRRSGLLEREWPRLGVAAATLTCIAVVTLTYDLNQGPFRLLEAVVMMFGTVGHPLLFPLTALVGSLMVILLARLLPAWAWLQHLGAITLIVYCLHGFFYHFVNPPLAAWMHANLAVDSGWVLAIATTAGTLASLAIAAPVAVLIDRYLPEMVGRRRTGQPPAEDNEPPAAGPAQTP